MQQRRAILISLIIPILWLVPVMIGYFTAASSDTVFLGWIRSDDFHRYGSFIDQTADQNRIIYKDYSTVRPQEPRMIAIYFTILGLIRKVIGIPAQFLWLLSGVIVGACFIRELFRFLDRWLPDTPVRIPMALLILFSTGLEWLFIPGGISLPRPRNFWMDGFSTFNTFHNPLKIAGILVGLWFCHQVLCLERKWTSTRMTGAIFLVLLLWTVHPNSAIPIYTAVLAAVVIPLSRQNYFKRLVRWTPLLIPFLGILLYVEWMKTDPMTANIIKQYHVSFAREPLWTYPIRYSVILFLGVPGFFIRLRRAVTLDILMAGWLVGAIFFSMYPGMTGLLFQHMIHLPLAYFAAFPLTTLLRRFPRGRTWIRAGLVLLFLAGNAYGLVKVSRQTADDVWPTSLYLEKSEVRLMTYLKTLPPGNVLINRDTGNKVAWLSLHNVYLGHWGTTPQKRKKERELREFYVAGGSAEWRETFLASYQIRYIWYGPRENELGPFPEDLSVTVLKSDADTRLLEITR